MINKTAQKLAAGGACMGWLPCRPRPRPRPRVAIFAQPRINFGAAGLLGLAGDGCVQASTLMHIQLGSVN